MKQSPRNTTLGPPSRTDLPFASGTSGVGKSLRDSQTGTLS